MFTDMVGSTDAVARGAGAASDALRRELFALLRGAVRDSGGTEVKNLGDGLMATFPSVAAGVSCAVATQRRVSRHNRRGSGSIHIRAGLSIGDATSEDGDWFGRTPVEAARLCDCAGADQILVSAAIQTLAEPELARFQSVGELSLKGLGTPTQAYEVLWSELDGKAHLPLPPLIEAARPDGFAGRAAERTRLEAALEDADRGRRQVVLISGEPGIGKTALAIETAIAAHARGMPVLYGRC
jgi:hypothetical protein